MLMLNLYNVWSIEQVEVAQIEIWYCIVYLYLKECSHISTAIWFHLNFHSRDSCGLLTDVRRSELTSLK